VSGGRPGHPTPAEEEALRHRAKGALRRRMKGVRSALPASARAARSQAAAARVVDLHGFDAAGTILVYAPIGAEASPAAVVEAARAAGKAVALPRVDFDAGVLRLHRWDAGAPLHRGGLGVPEPPPDAPCVAEADVDLVIVPALAVDTRGHRIGYGKGFYDQLLPTLPRAGRVAFVYDFQLLAELPNTPGDVPVHVIATDARVIMVESWPDAS
jgi:5-formyltetrahydrofolate cyclo-ligase